MKIIKIISRHKRNKRNLVMKGLWHAKVGLAECIVEEKGKLVTRHVKI